MLVIAIITHVVVSGRKMMEMILDIAVKQVITLMGVHHHVF